MNSHPAQTPRSLSRRKSRESPSLQLELTSEFPLSFTLLRKPEGPSEKLSIVPFGCPRGVEGVHQWTVRRTEQGVGAQELEEFHPLHLYAGPRTASLTSSEGTKKPSEESLPAPLRGVRTPPWRPVLLRQKRYFDSPR